MFTIPFAGRSATTYLPLYQGPAQFGTNTEAQYIAQFNEVLVNSAQLDDTRKVTSDYWADDATVHWHTFAIQAAIAGNLNRADTIRLLFLHANAAFDASIHTWALKRLYDSVRPITAIQCLNPGTITAWRGFYQGVGSISGSAWRPYQSDAVLTPNHGGYVAAHASIAAASATVFAQFFGDDVFRGPAAIIFPPGSSTLEPIITSGTGFIANVTDVPNSGPNTVGYSPATTITLTFNTWTQAANSVAISRIYGGIHTRSDITDALDLGTRVGNDVYRRGSSLFTSGAFTRNSQRDPRGRIRTLG
jgi:hypothetical protein